MLRPRQASLGLFVAVLWWVLTLGGKALLKTTFRPHAIQKYLCDTTPCKANGEEVYVLSCHSRAHKAQGRNYHGHVDRPKGVIWPLVEKL